LEQISAYLDAVKTADNLKPRRALEIVDLLDRTARPLQRRLTQDYIAETHRLTKFQKARLWASVHNYATQLTEGYRFCLAKYEVGAVGSPALKPYLPRITCRALRSCAERLKWTLFQYSPIDPQVWQDLGSLYQLAESLQFSRTSLRVYRGAKSESTAERELLRALMLAISVPEGLFAVQIQLTERIVEQLSGQFLIAPRPAPGIHFNFDVSGNQPPERISANAQFNSSSRCFGPGGAVAVIENMNQFIEQNGLLPPDLRIAQHSDAGLVKITLAHLSRYWSRMLPERKARRRRQVERVTVVHEYEEVVANVGGLFLESPFVSNDEEWVVENESDGGFGAFVPYPNGGWIKVGNLIGIRREDGVAWGAGIVRRVAMDEQGNRHVGIQMLARGGAAVTIAATSVNAKPNAAAEGEVCVLLPSGNAHSGEAVLLMRANFYSPSRNLLMRAYDRKYLLFPLGTIEKTGEFDVARYRILEELH
ncbi:MAG: hypothetical protein ABI612_18635, partial [Betaproteobacteria bacterium]